MWIRTLNDPNVPSWQSTTAVVSLRREPARRPHVVPRERSRSEIVSRCRAIRPLSRARNCTNIWLKFSYARSTNMPLAILHAHTCIWVSGRSEGGEARTEGDCRDMFVHAWGGSLFGTVFWPYCLGGCARTCRSERLGGFARALRSPREVRTSSRTGYSSIRKVIGHFVNPIYRDTPTLSYMRDDT